MTSVLLATCAAWPQGEPGGDLLLTSLEDRGVAARWACWDQPGPDWAAAELVVVRSTWDYTWRLPEFLSWARSVGASLMHGADVFAWNCDKAYLVELTAAGLPVVPTIVAAEEGDLPSTIAAFDIAVVKPATSASGRGVVVFDGADGGPAGLDEGNLGPGPWVVQPLVESVRTEGEHSVFVIGGEPVSQVRKVPAGGEIRVHEWYGGSTSAVPLDEEAATLARRTVAAAEGILGTRLYYGRVDLLRMPGGTLAVGELEVIEPGLYLDILPGNAAPFADMVAARLHPASS